MPDPAKRGPVEMVLFWAVLPLVWGGVFLDAWPLISLGTVALVLTFVLQGRRLWQLRGAGASRG